MHPHYHGLDKATGRLRISSFKFDFDVIHRAGIRNYAANAFLLLETECANIILLKDDIPELDVSLVQNTDPKTMKRILPRLTSIVYVKAATSL